MRQSLKDTIDKYLRFCKNGDWIKREAYKFEFANYLNIKVDLENDSDSNILETLIQSQKIKYTGPSRGVQFILKSGRKELSEFVSLKDIELFKELRTRSFSDIDWSDRTMSFTGLSAWIATFYPDRYYPIPMKGFDETIKYLFGSVNDRFSKVGDKYFLECQPYMQKTWDCLKQYPMENLFLSKWNEFISLDTNLNIPLRTEFSEIDKVWLVQDFHLFVHREILGLYKLSGDKPKVADDIESYTSEGKSVLSKHIRYERNNSFIRKIKEKALLDNKMLNCQVCGFSFYANYGEIGQGFIEAHHLAPLNENDGDAVLTKREDIALVCSNCHRMLHRGNPTFSLEELSSLLHEDI